MTNMHAYSDRSEPGRRSLSAFLRTRQVVPVACLVVLGSATALLAALRHGDVGEVGPGTPALSKAAGPVAGEAYLWRPVAIGGGGFVTGIAADDQGNTRVIRTDVHGAYRWDAKADRWEQLVTAASMPEAARVQNGMNEGAYEIAVAPGDGRRLYLAIKGAVYRSDDRGRHWTRPTGAGLDPLTFYPNGEFRLYGPFLAVSPIDPNLLFLGTPGAGLWRSNDGAASWSRVADVPAGADLRPAAGVQSPGIVVRFGPKQAGGGATPIYAASPGHGLLVSVDDGASFRPLGKAGPVTVAQAAFAADGSLFAVDTEAKKAWVYRHDSWRELTGAGGLAAAAFVGVAVDRAGGAVYVTDQGGQGWCSADGGARWSTEPHSTTVGEGEPPWLRVNGGGYFASGQIGFDPVVASRLWVASGVGPYFADVGPGCGSLTWKSQVRGIEELVANDVVQPPGHAPLFAAWDFGIHVRADLDAYSTTYGPKERVLISAQQLDWSPADPGFVVTNASDARIGCCSEDGDAVLAGFSRDGGHHWQKFESLPTPPGTKANDPWRMAFGTIAVAADRTDNIVWAPAFNRSPFYTLDRGVTWRKVTLPGEDGPDTGSFQNYYGARKTLAADRVRPGTFYLVHSGEAPNAALRGLWRTTDRGATWTRVFTGEIAPNSGFSAKLRAVPGEAGHLFFTAAVGFGPDTRLRRSRDGGATWQALDGVDHVDDVAFGRTAAGAHDPTIFVSGLVGGHYGIWRSTDDAASWQRVAGFPLGRLDQVTVVEGDKDVFGRVYVGYMGSGWLYGSPAGCAPRPFAPGDDRDCEAVAPARR